MWQALKVACETPDRPLAQVILESAGIQLPAGQLTHSYDERGNHYVIPEFCLAFPQNVMDGDSPQPIKQAAATKASPRVLHTNVLSSKRPDPEITITLRISTGRDIQAKVHTSGCKPPWEDLGG